MDLVVLILVHGAFFITYYPQSVTGIDFTASPNRVVKGDTGRLTMRCSVNEIDVNIVYTIRIKRETSPGSNQFQLFASFVQNTVTKLDEAKLSDQITNDREFLVSGDKSGSPPYLQLTMSMQTMDCSDARLYSCDYTYESTSDQTFTFRQNATLEVFVLPSMTSLIGRKNGQFVDGGSLSNKAEIHVGDLLQLTCEATIGSIDTTKIRWERSSETGSGYIAANGVAYTINDGTALRDNQCGYVRKATFAYNVTASDSTNSLSFRCYVTVSGYPLSSPAPGGSYTTPNRLQYHLDVLVECPQDTFGEECSENCYCAAGTCTHNSGICPGKCRSGFRGPHCNEECPEDTFGEDCSKKCYCASGTCTHNSGICPGKCRSGFRGPHCNEAGCETENISLIIGGTAGTTAALFVIAAIIGFVVYRACHKNRSSCNNDYTTPNMHASPTETPAYDTLDNVNDIRGSDNNACGNEKVSGF